MSILNGHTDINISPEMHILEPFWLHKDFVRRVEEEVGDLKNDKNIPKLIELMKSQKLSGSFWNLVEIDENRLLDQMINSDRSIKDIFHILMINDAKSKNKNRIGAKFPVHFSYVSELIEWFPKCKVVHLVRDPRAIYASQTAKMNNVVDSKIGYSLKNIIVFSYINISCFWAGMMHKKYKNKSNYYVSRYEDVVLDPKIYISKLCEFLNTEYSDKMLHPPVRDSSFNEKKPKDKGMNEEAVYRWKEKVHPVTALLIKSINYRTMREFKYI